MHHRPPLSQLSWDQLSPALQERRERSLTVLRKMRQGSTLTAAAKEVGINRGTALRHLGNAVVKRGGRYFAKPTDRISRGLVINSRGKQATVTVNDSKSASIIGEYHNAVKQYLESGDDKVLKKFRKISIVDNSHGKKKYRLETDGEKLLKIEEGKEDREFFEIYNTG